ncbi:MAG: molecular chaperone DnaJ [Lutibacter sp.]
MISTLQIDTLAKASSEVVSKVNTDTSNYNYWIWIAILELIVIIYLLFFWRKSESARAKNQYKKEAKEGDIDFGNIINSSFNVKPLYDELKVKCHPDRFPNDETKNKIALELFQNISKNKTNYKKLIELKELAIDKLNINF